MVPRAVDSVRTENDSCAPMTPLVTAASTAAAPDRTLAPDPLRRMSTHRGRLQEVSSLHRHEFAFVFCDGRANISADANMRLERRFFVPGLLILLTAVCACRSRPVKIGPAQFYWLMDRACWIGDELAVRMLLDAGADPNGVSDYAAFHKSPYAGLEPSWPINQAAWGGHAGVVRLLLAAGAKAHAPEGEGQTALTIAAEKGHTEVVRLLLAAGADRTYRAPGGKGFVGTAEEIARRSGHEALANFIRDFRGK